MSRTAHDVQLAYGLKDGASAGLLGIARNAGEAESATTGLASAFAKLGAAIGGIAIIHQAKAAFIDFNAEIESSKTSIASVSRMFGQSSDFGSAMKEADAVFERYQEAAKASTATTKDFVDMHKTMMPAMAAAGIQGKRLEEMVKGAVIAAPMLGFDADYFARDVQSVMSGTVSVKDKAAVMMLASMGLDKESFNKKAREQVGYSAEVLEKFLAGPTVKEAAKAAENTFKGVTSTLEDTVQILAAQAGKPLFKVVTDEIRSWNTWLEKNKDAVEAFTKKVGEGLVTAFNTLRDVLSWIVEHKDTLLTVAYAYGAAKVGSAALSGASAIASAGSFVKTGLAIGGSMGGVGTSMGASALAFATAPATIAAIAAAVIGYGGYKLWQASTASAAKGAAIEGGISGAGAIDKHYNVWGAIRGGDERAQGLAYQAGLIGADGSLDMKKAQEFAMRFGNSTAQVNEIMEAFVFAAGKIPMHAQAAADLFETINAKTRQPMAEFADMLKMAAFNWSGGLFQFKDDAKSDPKKQNKVKKDPGTNITIQRVEVTSEDPDRFVVGIVALADRAASRRTQALSAIPSR